MASIENRPRTQVTFKKRDDLTKAFAHNADKAIQDYVQELRSQGQLLACLRWSDGAMKLFTREPGQSYIFYAPDHPDSVRYTDSGSEIAIDAATSWVRCHFPASIRGNFQGERGQLALMALSAKNWSGWPGHWSPCRLSMSRRVERLITLPGSGQQAV